MRDTVTSEPILPDEEITTRLICEACSGAGEMPDGGQCTACNGDGYTYRIRTVAALAAWVNAQREEGGL